MVSSYRTDYDRCGVSLGNVASEFLELYNKEGL